MTQGSNNPHDEYYNNFEKYAMARLSYYTCYECKKPYYGGLKDWGNMLEAAADFDPEELVCGKCASKGLEGQGKSYFYANVTYSHMKETRIWLYRV